jgi:uncharacterized repeat protein (TIGR01451 family)
MSTVRPLFLSLLCLLSFAAEAASPLIDAKLTVALIQYNGQVEVAATAAAAKPGDVLEYSARYANRGTAAAESLSPAMPIPAGTEFIPTDLSPKPTHASLDGATFAPIPLHRSVKGADGVTRLVEVPPGEYRALRWAVGTLAVGSEITVKARVRVSPVVTPVAVK